MDLFSSVESTALSLIVEASILTLTGNFLNTLRVGLGHGG